ncbi:hypothetical protein [Eudoraea sp.]|uniref:hypothetical protein n=1 Tax=Eudoraea sp. TaxID=1979955 RepID=UPI003C70CA54
MHIKPWGTVENRFPEDVWELYHVEEDFSMSTNLAKERPGIVELMQKVFLGEAEKYKVLPMDDRRQELFNPNLAGRPDLMFGRKSLTLYEGMTGMLENDFINSKNSSFEIVADIESNDKGTNGVIISQAGRFGGWSFYVNEGTLTYVYNYVGLEQYKTTANIELPQGKSTVKMDFAYDGGDKPGQGGTATLYINGEAVGSGKIDATQFSIFSADESANVGLDSETPVSNDYDFESSKFNGKIDKVTITLK